MRRLHTPAGVVHPDDPVLRVRGERARVRGHGGGRGRRAVRHVVQDRRRHRRRHRRACAARAHAALLCLQAQVVRYPRVGVGDVGAVRGGAAVHRRAGGHARALRLRVRHLPLLPRGTRLLRRDGLLHPVREQLLPDVEECGGHGGPSQVRLLTAYTQHSEWKTSVITIRTYFVYEHRLTTQSRYN